MYERTHSERVSKGEKVALYNGFSLWTDDEDSALEQLYFDHLLLSDIARILNRSLSSIRSRVSRKGYSRHQLRRHTFTCEEDKYIRRHYGSKSTLEIASHLGLSVRSIRERATKRLNLKRCYFGENNPASTISDCDVELMRQLHDEGLGPTEIARKMEVSLTHAKCILNYRYRSNGLPDYIFDMSELR